MPRNSQGLYTLPPGNPVTPGTLIESGWANTTLGDVASALTGSVPRDGSAPMTGQLTLPSNPPTNGRHATNKAYVDSFLAFATGLPIGAIISYPSLTPPPGFLLCNGQAISRTTYSLLFGLIGTTFGEGDGTNTFNLPDLQDQFVRGRGTGRAMGSKQADAIKSHNHPYSDPGHSHPLNDPGHTHAHVDTGHSHPITDPGHTHYYDASPNMRRNGSDEVDCTGLSGRTTGSSFTGISVNAATTGVTNVANTTGITSAAAQTGINIGAAGDTETRPVNTALDFYIKAIADSSGPGAVVSGITSNDTNAIAINSSDPQYPELQIKTNIAFGLVKLDANNKVPNSLLDVNLQTFLGTYDASTGNNPSQQYPLVDFGNGDTYVVSVPGTLSLYAADGSGPTPTPVQGGWYLVFQEGLATPDGWYYVEPTVAQVAASNVAFAPSGNLSATNVQDAIVELDNEKPDVASEVPFTPPPGMSSTNVQDGITEAFNAAGGTPQAVNVTFSPTAGISATNVQLAIEELENETPDLAGNGATGTWPISVTGSAASAATAVDATNAINAVNSTTQAYGDADTSIATTAFVDRLRDVPAVANAAPRNFALTDRGQSIDTTANVTVPDNATVAFPIGATVSVTNMTASPLTIAQGANVTLRLAGTTNVGDRTLAGYGVATLRKVATNTWVIMGAGVS